MELGNVAATSAVLDDVRERWHVPVSLRHSPRHGRDGGRSLIATHAPTNSMTVSRQHQSPRRFSDQALGAVWVAAGLLVLSAPATAQTAATSLRAAVHREAGRLAQSTAASQPSAAKANPSWIARHPVIVGTLIGAGTGAVLSRVDAIGGANHDPTVALVGAAAGAWGGLVASAVQKSRAKKRVTRGTKIGIVAGAIGLVVMPIVACYGAGGCGGSS